MKITAQLISSLLLIFFSPVTISSETVSKSEAAIGLLNEFSSATTPGIQYIVVNTNSSIFEHTIGLADIKSNTALKPTHTMAAFSMTKTLTAIAILQLNSNNKISINAPLSQYIKHPYDQAITIKQALSHTAGIPSPIPLKWVHLTEEHPRFNEKTTLTNVLTESPDSVSEPGHEYDYSDIGYWLLGSVIEKVSNKTYVDYITDNIFKPLNLSPDMIGFVISNKENHAKGYIKKWSFMNIIGGFLIDEMIFGEQEGSWVHIKNVYPNGPSFGGAIGTAKSFAKILQDLLSPNSKLLTSDAKALLYSQQSVINEEKIDMSLGWHIGKIGTLTYYYKEGGGAGFCGEMRVYPEKGIATVLMTNRTSFNFKKDMSKLDKIFLSN